MRMIQFIKNWTLPIAMISGIVAYFVGSSFPLSGRTKHAILEGIHIVQPCLLFVMLFVAFCKVKPSELKPRIWHLWLVLFQTCVFVLCCGILWLMPDMATRYVLESILLVVVCPTATACAVVTQKLGGDSATTTTYTILINIAVAILIPILLPFAHPQEGISFLPAFLIILKRVFPILILPLLLAWLVRYSMPRFHASILQTKDLAFYFWAVALSLAIAVSCKALIQSRETVAHVFVIAIATLAACLLQFHLGRRIGGCYGYRTEGGQVLGQKNTVFIIWLAYTFLSPVSATAGGFYSIWHNVVNSHQLWKKRKMEDEQKNNLTNI